MALLDSAPAVVFDRLARLAARTLRAPVALIALVDADRHVFKGCVGLPEPWASTREIGLAHSICRHTAASGEPLVIADARAHPLTRENPASPDISVVAYAGVPLVTSDGYALGSFCVIDHEPRDWTPAELAILTDLAASTMTELELYAAAAEHSALLDAARRARGAAERANHTVERERAILRQVLDALPEGVLLADARGECALSNQAARDILGRDPVGRSLIVEAADDAAYGVRRLDRTPYSRHDLPVARALRGEVVRGEQLRVGDTADAPDIPVLMNGVPLRDAAGAITGAAMVFQDITTIKNFERARDELLASVSHDLRNPLTAIQGLAELSQQQAARGSTPSSERMAARQGGIVTAATQMTALLNELLDAMHLEMGQPLALDCQPVDLAALVDRVVAHQREIASRHIRVETAAPGLVCAVDADRIERVVGNLISNAIKYSPTGGEVAVLLAREQAAGAGAGEWAVLTVHDSGRGVPTADLPRVFDRFYRGENVGGVQGTGIGLASARQIVEQHGGTIEARSVEGRGSTFTVRLPLDMGAPRVQPAPPEGHR